jgi:hypothetical protein
MRRFISFVAAVALLAGAAACQREAAPGEASKAVFSVVVPEAATKADVSDGSLVDKLFYEVYVGNTMMYSGDVGPVSTSNPKTFSLEINLVKGITYDILFWAQKGAQTCYDLSNGLKRVMVSYDGDANDETRDAFYAACKNFQLTDETTTVYLTRPFAQINFGSHSTADSTSDWKTALPFMENADGTLTLLSQLEAPKLPTCFDVHAGDVVDGHFAENVVLEFSAAPATWGSYGTDIIYQNETYKRVSMNYVLASSLGDELTQVKASFKHNFNASTPLEQVVLHVPVRQNYRTNILGNVFTDGNEFTIIVKPGFTDDYIL